MGNRSREELLLFLQNGQHVLGCCKGRKTHGAEELDLSCDLGADVIGDTFEVKYELGEGLPVVFLPLADVFETVADFLGSRIWLLGSRRLLAITGSGELPLECSRGCIAWSLVEELGFGLLLC